MPGKLIYGRKITIILFLLVLVQSIFIVNQIMKKNGYHIDEIYSFGLSNSYNQAFLNENNAAQNHWIDQSYFNKYLSVQPGERFRYGSVYNNQVKDVHPPLFYMALHTLSSFFPDQFSKWPAGIMNLVIFIIIQSFLFLLSMKIFNRNILLSFSTVILYGCAMIAVDTIVYIRMYAMLTMFAVISIYLHVHLMEDNKSFLNTSLILIVTYLGCLTHYYFLVLSFIIALLSCIYLLFNKQFKYLIVYATGMGVSVGAMIGTFPAVLEHLYGGRKVGNQTLENVRDMTGAIGRIINYIHQTAYGYFGTKYIYIVVISLFVFLLSAMIFKAVKNNNESRYLSILKDHKAIIIIAVSTTLTFMIISWIAFDAYTRYIYYLMPIVALCIIATAYLLAVFAQINMRKFSAITLIIVIFTGSYNFTFRNSSHLYNTEYRNMRTVSEYAESYGVFFCREFSNSALTAECMSLVKLSGIYSTSLENIDDAVKAAVVKSRGNGVLVWVDTNNFWSSGYNAEHIISTILNTDAYSESQMLYKTGLVEVFHVK
jgi:hypothetical protein